MDDPALDRLRSFDYGVGDKRPHERAIRAIRRLNNVHLGLEDDPEPIGEASFFYLDGLHREARRQDRTKRRRVDPEPIPREDGREWAPGDDSDTFGPEFRAELFRRRDLLLQDPDFAFIELVAGAAYTRVERLYDQENLDATFLATQKVLSDQARIRAIEVERSRMVLAQVNELRTKLDEARRTLTRVEPQTRLAAEGQSLLAALEVTQADLDQAIGEVVRARGLRDLVGFFDENFAGTAFTYEPANYTLYYADQDLILRTIRSQVDGLADRNLPGARALLAYLDALDVTDEQRSDALTRSLFYVVAHFMAEVASDVEKVAPPRGEESPRRPRRRAGEGFGIEDWRRLARNPDLATLPVDEDLFVDLWRMARGQNRQARINAGLVLETRQSSAQRSRNVSQTEQTRAATAVGTFVTQRLRRGYQTTAGAIAILRDWIESFEPARRDLEQASIEWQRSLARLESELARLQEIRAPELPYEHRMQWALRPENSGRVELEPIVRFGMEQAWGWVRRWLPMAAAGGPKALERSSETRGEYARLVANAMALAMNRFQVRWLPQKHREFAIRDAGTALRNLAVYRWDRGREKFLHASTALNEQMMRAVGRVIADVE